MRFGYNPLRSVQQPPPLPSKVTVATVVCIPHLAGYFEQSLDILQLMLASLRANTDMPYELLVFDNASCSQVRDFLARLHQEDGIQYLVFADRDWGLAGAYNFIFSYAPGDYVAYTDSDVYFYPGWLSECLKVLEHFPNVGMVSAFPVRQGMLIDTRSTLGWARTDPRITLEEGRLIKDEWIAEYCESVGKDPAQFLKGERAGLDYRVTLNGISAFVGGDQFQFVVRRSIASRVLPLDLTSHHLMKGSLAFRARLDQAGYLRLSTDGVFVHHLGNHLTPRWQEEARRLGVVLSQRRKRVLKMPHWRYRLVRSRFVYPVLAKLYVTLFEILARQPE